MKKIRKTERRRTRRKRKQVQPRSVATTPKDEALQESEAKFRSLVETTAVPIGMVNLTGEFTCVNKALANLTGYSVQELVGRPFMEFLHPEDREMVLKVFNRDPSTSEEASEIEFRIKHRDGQILTLTSKPTRVQIKGKTVGFQAIITNITQRILAEQTLRLQSEIVENMFEGVVLTRASDGVIMYANPRYEEMLGYASGELIGKNVATVNASTNDKTPEGIAREIQTHLKETGVWSGEVLNVKKDGTPVWCRAKVSTLESPQYGKVWVGALEDITEHKRAEEALRLSEAKYRALVDNASDFIFSIGKKDEVIAINPAGARFLGKTVEQVLGKSLLDVYPKEIATMFSENVRAVLQTGKGKSTDERLVVAGNELWINTRLEPLLDDRNRAYAVTGVARNITEHKRDDETRARLAAIVESSDDAIIGKTLDGIITSWNKGAEKIYGYSAGEMIGKPVSLLFPPGRQDELKEILEKVRRGEPAQHYESERARKDGRVISVSLSVSPIRDSADRIVGASTIARDVTDRKNAEQSLRESEVMYRRLFEASQEGIAILDADTQKIIDANPYLQRLSGYSIEQLRQRELWEIEPFKDIRRRIDFEELQEREFVRVEPLPVKVKEKGSIDIELVSTSYEVGGRRVIQCNIHDITERMRLQKELERHANHLQELVAERTRNLRAVTERLGYVVKSNPAVIYTAKPLPDGSDFLLTYLSERVVQMLGYAPEDFVGSPDFWERHVLPEDVRQVRAEMPRLWKEGRYTVEYRFLHKNGTYRWIREEATLIRDGDGEPIEVNGYWTDVTERKQMEEKLGLQSAALKESEERFRGIAETSLDAILTVDLEGKITYASPATAKITGYSENELLGVPMQRFLPESEIPNLMRIFSDAMRGEASENVELGIMKKDGSTVRLWFHGSPILRNGELTGFEAVARDITERKRMEERLAEAQRLAAIGETTAMVGHDLRNPLQGIVSTVYLAKRKLESLLESSGEVAVKPSMVDMLETIENEAEYMDKIVSDLQDYAAPLKAEPKPVQMEPLVKDTLSKIRVPQNVKVLLKVSEALQRVMLDPIILRRVFTNLIMNAIQSMPDGGELRIDMSGTDGFLFVVFKDTGVGIPEANMDKLFNPLFTTKAKGQGLGLAVCKRLVEAQDGIITVESKPGEGSTFTVKLPFMKP